MHNIKSHSFVRTNKNNNKTVSLTIAAKVAMYYFLSNYFETTYNINCPTYPGGLVRQK